MIFIIILIIILILFFIHSKIKEHYNGCIPFNNGYTDFIWNNSRIGNTRNMSYDIRGDPIIIPKINLGWNYGIIQPIYNRNI